MALGQNYAPSLLKCNIKRVLFKKFSKKFSHHDGIMLNALIILTRRLLYYSREASTDASASSSDWNKTLWNWNFRTSYYDFFFFLLFIYAKYKFI